MFEATFESLYEYECPDWFRDAKFGIWSHWGPQSVPMCGDWYARNMYIEGSPQYLYHVRHYGHPSKFGYKDICKLWKAENFDPDGLMELYYKAGARYFVAQAVHHDNFFNYDSAVNRFNSKNIGPMRDICMLWKNAAKKYDLPFGLSEHLGASFSWWQFNKHSDKYGKYKGVPYDGNDPEYADFYHANYEHVRDYIPAVPWYTDNKNYHKYWLDSINEMIEKFTPELLYTDGSLPFGKPWHTDEEGKSYAGDEIYNEGLCAVSRLYNKSIEVHGKNQAVYLQKDRRPEIYNVGILDIEKSQLPGISERPWHTDTCIGNWFYDAKQPYKRCDQIIEMLVEIIAKNGTMLLNILQKPDGTIDDEAEYILKELAGWFSVCGNGVYGTRPWKVYGEGETRVKIDGFTEEKTSWNPSDYRFVQKNGKVYAFVLCPPENRICVIKSFSDCTVKNVKLLGASELEFYHNLGILTVKLPPVLPTPYVNCLEIEI